MLWCRNYFDLSGPTFGQSLLREAGTRVVIISTLEIYAPEFLFYVVYTLHLLTLYKYTKFVMNVDHTI